MQHNKYLMLHFYFLVQKITIISWPIYKIWWRERKQWPYNKHEGLQASLTHLAHRLNFHMQHLQKHQKKLLLSRSRKIAMFQFYVFANLIGGRVTPWTQEVNWMYIRCLGYPMYVQFTFFAKGIVSKVFSTNLEDLEKC